MTFLNPQQRPAVPAVRSIEKRTGVPLPDIEIALTRTPRTSSLTLVIATRSCHACRRTDRHVAWPDPSSNSPRLGCEALRQLIERSIVGERVDDLVPALTPFVGAPAPRTSKRAPKCFIEKHRRERQSVRDITTSSDSPDASGERIVEFHLHINAVMPFRANPAAFRRLANRRFDRAGGRGGVSHPRLPGELLRSLHDREHPFLGLAYLTHSERIAIPKPPTTTPSCPKTWRGGIGVAAPR